MSIFHYPVVNITGATGPTGSSGPASRSEVTTGIYNASSIDQYIGVTYTGGATFINLAPGAINQSVIVKDEAGVAGANHITITASSGETIDGSGSTTILANHGVVRLWFNYGWHII